MGITIIANKKSVSLHSRNSRHHL